MALIATCGHGMVHHMGTAAKLFSALAKEGINVRMIDQGSSELNIIVGIESSDYEKAIKAIYNGFVN
jgi:aspartate kinase